MKFQFKVFLTIFFIILNQALLAQVKEHKEDKVQYPYQEFKDQIIDSIEVEVLDVFDEKDPPALYSFANSLKKNSKVYVILRELLFKEGDKFNPFLVKESERNLRNQRFLRNISVVPYKDKEKLKIKVKVQDTWTLIPQVNATAGTGSNNVSMGLSESNLLGLGKRVESLYEINDNRTSYSLLYDDPRLLGTPYRLITGGFTRVDGASGIISLTKPFRTLADTSGFEATVDGGDTVGRLFAAGDERYIYRQRVTNLTTKYTWADGNLSKNIRRYSLGFDIEDANFIQATTEDYDALNLNPKTVSNDKSLLPDNRTYFGPTVGFSHIKPRYGTVAYVDRFDREEDYNFGDQFNIFSTFATKSLGSKEDAILYSLNRSIGAIFSSRSFLRGEVGLSGRRNQDGFENTLLRTETRYYNVLGKVSALGEDLGNHTLAFGLTLDIGNNLDRDREFNLGSDTGLRGYTARTFYGDKRLLISCEDRIHLYENVLDLVSVGAAFFADAGAATYDNLDTMLQNKMYGDVGVGLRIAFPRSSGGRVLRVDLAYPFRDGPDGSGALEARLVFIGGQPFGARLRSESLGAENANVGVGFDR